MSDIENSIGVMFYNKQPIPIILEMTYSDLKYWTHWHEIIQKEWKKAGGNTEG